MKIALVGYGKMGKAIEQIAINRGHEIVLKINSENAEELNEKNLKHIDVAIEFTKPSLAFNNVKICLDNSVPVVCGTTAWTEKIGEIEQLTKEKNGSFIYGSNFSLGVNLFFALNEYAAQLMNKVKVYETELTEIHHTAKLDAPSGTAITLAEGIINNSDFESWVKGKSTSASQLGIISERKDPAPGTHIITYSSDIDTIELKHEAHSRVGFATGAVVAAEWLLDKKGVFTMKDVLGL
jgi:4-hydroxy-tetrahydrodipicolinate reductase